MNITLFGSSGKVGKLVTEELLSNGHIVTAFVHSNTEFMDHPHLTFVKGDVHEPSDVAKVLKNSDIVISVLGSWGTKSKDILSTAMKYIVPEMEASNIRRIISLTGSGAQVPGDDITALKKFEHSLMGIAAKKILQDSEEHIRLLKSSSLDWTVIRSPVMTKQNNSTYKLDNKSPKPWETIPRQAVAAAIVSILNDNTYNCAAPYIHRS